MTYAKIKPLIKLNKNLNLLDYIIPENLKIEIGQLIEIPFRNKNIYGIVFSVQNNNTAKYKLKTINKIIDEKLLSETQIEFYNWFCEYNFSSLNFINNIIPTPLKRKTNNAKKIELELKKIPITLKKIPESILKNKKFIFKHNYFEEKISLIKKVIDSQKEVLIFCPTKLELQKIYSVLLNFYNPDDFILIDGKTHLNKTKHNQIWKNIQSKKNKIILGTKTSIFYPLSNIKTIIVDEIENENHNQIDINPRFEFLPNIIKVSEINKTQLILTSYAPPVNIYKLAQEKKIKLLESKSTIKTKIHILEMNLKYFENQIHFNTENYMNEILEKKGKVLFLSNKKAYSKNIHCSDCGYIFKCKNCNSILNLKIDKDKKSSLFCYNCKKESSKPIQCPECKNINLKSKGIGSKQLFSKIQESFPTKKTILIDQDHAENLKLIDDNEIIIATKLILDHINAKDFNLIVLPITQQFLNNNFNSNEKFFQFISKLISKEPEKIILQTLNQLEIYDYIKSYNYLKMSEEELKLRKLFHFPPFYEMLKITIKDKTEKELEKKIKKIYNELKDTLPEKGEISEIINPQIKKSFSFFRKYITIKYPINSDTKKLRTILNKIDIIDKNYFKL